MTARLADGVVDDAFEKDDPILEEQVAQGHLALPRVVAVALEHRVGERRFKGHGRVPENQDGTFGFASAAGTGALRV